MKTLTCALALSLAPVIALADPLHETTTEGNALTAAPSEWLGETPHLVIMGTVNGYSFDVQYPDLAAADLHNIEVKREYLIDGDARPYQELDYELQAIIGGVAKTIEGKLNHADFLTLDLPATLEIQSDENPEGENVFAEFEFEWEHDGVSVNEEHGDWTGTVTMVHDDAFGASEPTADGISGGFIDAKNGDDHIVISYTFEIMEAEVDD